jgi:catechol 2,3-dioxygenase-like lactoylglutathione lyase family enzyme
MQFDHVALKTKDIPAAIAWYQQNFPDVKVLHSDPTWGFVELGGLKIAFVLPGHHPPHVAYRISDEELERRAAAMNKTIKTHRDGTRSFYSHDADDNVIEYISYPPGNKYE